MPALPCVTWRLPRLLPLQVVDITEKISLGNGVTPQSPRQVRARRRVHGSAHTCSHAKSFRQSVTSFDL